MHPANAIFSIASRGLLSFALAAFALQSLAHESAAHESARSAEEWVKLGEALHGGFGSHIALGIRIGEDALARLGAQRREVDVVVTEGKAAPCACLADGIALATAASPGQRSLLVKPKSEDASYLALVEVKSRRTGTVATYRVPASAIEPLAKMNPGKSAQMRYELVMAVPVAQIFSVALSAADRPEPNKPKQEVNR